MTKIKHHLSDSLLQGYAVGTLPEAFNLAVAAHLSYCDECRAALGAFEAVGGALLEDGEAIDLSDDALSNILGLLDGPEVTEKPKLKKPGIFPPALQDYVGGDLESVKWRSIGMGVKQAILPTSKSATARLLYIPAGSAVPDHGHRGTELTLVLQGAFSDEDGQFGVGDIEVADEEVDHTPIADAGMDCICLAVTDAPLRFNSILPRLMQPFFKI